MQRRTFSLPDRLAAALDREAQRRRVPVSQVAREALEAKFGLEPGQKRKIGFAGLGRSGHGSIAANMEEIMRAEWTLDRDR